MNDEGGQEGARGPSLELDANLVLAAGAGAGKTHALVTVALGLYVGAGRSARAPLAPGRVWAVTFTEKAARELRQRIVARATALARDPEGALGDEAELAAMLDERPSPAPISRADWQAIVDQLHLAPIGTFHSLCAQVLRSFAVEAGVDPSFGVLEESGAAELFDAVLDEVLLRELEDPDSHTRAGARALGGPDQLRTALRRLHGKLGEEGRDPRSLLVDVGGQAQPGLDAVGAQAALTEASAALSRALSLLRESKEDRLRPTLRALAIESRRIGECEPLEVARWYPALVRVAGQRRGKGTLPKRAKRVWEPFAEAWEEVQDAVSSLAEIELAGRIVALLEGVGRAYAAEKKRQGVLDFVDLVRGAHDLLRDDRAVRAQLQGRVGALLVDEFQDTNGLQLDLVHLLAEARDRQRDVPRGERASALLPLSPRLLAAVGDRKQSVYEFRGADVSLFQGLAARAREGEAGLRLAALRRSWRSRPGLVAFANELFSQLLVSDDPAGFAVDWIDEVDVLEPVREDHEDQAGVPAVQLLLGDPCEDSRLRRGREATQLAEHVERLLKARPPLGRAGLDGRPAPLRGADVAILMRTHSHVARYRRALSERGIASVVVGGRGFYAAREVRELVALMLAIADPGDALASAAVWRSPVWGISDASLVALAEGDAVAVAAHVEGCSVEGLAAADVAAITHMGRLVNRLRRELDRLGPARVLRFAVDRLGVREVLAWDDAGEQRIANVDKLLAILGSREFAGVGAQAAARRLLERGADLLDREAPAEVASAADPKAVRIMTVHASKGLEFPVVVLPELGAEPRGQEGPVVFERELGLAVISPDLVGRRRPSRHAQAIHERLAARRDAESRRLLYVATTRARDLLVLLGEAPEGRAGEGNWRKLIDAALPDLEALDGTLEIVDGAPTVDGEGEPAAGGDDAAGAMAWLLERVGEARREATGEAKDGLSGETEASGASGSAWPEGSAALGLPSLEAEHTPPGEGVETREVLGAALARTQALRLRDCELELSLSGFAEFDKCPRRYLLTHVVGLDTPATEEREAMRGLKLLPFVPRRRADEDDAGDGRQPSLTEARDRGRLLHFILARVDLDRLGREPARTLDGFARSAEIPAALWLELREDLLRLCARPWFAELVEVAREDPRRVLRSLPFAVELSGEGEGAPAPAQESPHGEAQAQLDLFAPLSELEGGAQARPEGRVIVRGRMDLVWIDDAGQLRLLDWQYGRAPQDGPDFEMGSEMGASGQVLDPETVPGLRRMIQALALRRLWGPEVPLKIEAVFLREAEADPLGGAASPQVLAGVSERLRGTAARLLAIALGDGSAEGRGEPEPWPKLAHVSACGPCIHVGRCWKLETHAEAAQSAEAAASAELEPVPDSDPQDEADAAGEAAAADPSLPGPPGSGSAPAESPPDWLEEGPADWGEPAGWEETEAWGEAREPREEDEAFSLGEEPDWDD